jgi:protocatechuate 3,4-dioxygenase beta subunit
MTEGPYYTPDSPERTSLLEEGIPGTRLILTGFVLTQDCQPIANALLDFWQADGDGEYDNAGYKLRGHQLTDQAGSYYLETVLPGLYPGRTAHIHVKVQAPGGPVLTTQLFFPGVPGNDTDSIFSPLLLTTLQDMEGGKLATFNFILAVQ